MGVVFSGRAEPTGSDLLDIVSVLDRDTALERAAAVALDRTGARTAVLSLHDDPRRPLLVCRGLTPPEGRALCERLGSEGLSVSERAAPEVVRLRDPATGGEVLRVPVHAGRRVLADLLLADPPGPGFSEADLTAMAALGRVAAVAARNADTYATSERLREAGEATARLDEVLRRPEAEAETWTRVAEGAALIARADLVAVVRSEEPEDAQPPVVEVASVLGDYQQLPGLLDRLEAELAQAQTTGEAWEGPDGDGRIVVLTPLTTELVDAGVVVLVLHPERARWTGADRELLTAFAAHASLVLDRATLHAERQRAALADDRDRIARDLHDVVIQRLVATGLRLRALLRGGGDHAAHGEAMAVVATDLDESVRDIRTTIFDLERGGEQSLRADVLALAREYEEVLGFAPRVRTWGPVDSLVDPVLAAHTTAVLREALSNCARHAGAGRCEVDLGVEADRLHLVVVDDGGGPGGASGGGNGLRNLAARATRLGGTLVVDDAEGGGTRLHWQVPLDAQARSSSSGAGTA